MRNHTRASTRVLLLLTMMAAAVGVGIAAPTPALAACPEHPNEESFRATNCGRGTFVLDPGRFDLLDRSDLLAHAGRFGTEGFSEQFLWYSYETTRHFLKSDTSTRWTYCEDSSHTGFCSHSSIGTDIVTNTFTQDVTLSVFAYEDRFIARACGNFSVRPGDDPVPTIRGVKYHDLDADGTQDDEDPGLSGWNMRLHLEQSSVGQGAVDDLTTTTGPDGRYEFELRGRGPGTYSVTESGPSGWTSSTPVTQSVVVPEGIGNATVDGPSFGNVEVADVAKVAFHLVEPPTRLEVGESKDVTVRAVLRNEGPRQSVEVEDTLRVDGLDDCVVTPPQQSVRRRVDVGTDEIVDFVVTIRCDHRSFHDFTFRDDVRIVQPGVVDPDPSDNTRSFEWRVPVFEPADLAVTDMGIRCGERRAGPTSFVCTVRTDVASLGPADNVATATEVTLTGPVDCSIVPASAQRDERVLAAGGQASFTTEWNVSCLSPVRHSFLAEAVIATNEDHAEDRNPANNRRRARWVPIDVKPRSDPSSINIDKQGVVPAAILSTPDFDATSEVVVESLRFGRTGEEDSLVSCSATPEDVNDDGYPDLVCHFDTTLTGLQCGDTEAVLSGSLEDGTPFEGQDTVKIVPCKA